MNLSSPEGYSVNDEICPNLISVVYASVNNAVEIIHCQGPGTELVKMNLKDAYRVILVHPQDLHLLGIQWCGDTFVDRSLPFGLRSATKIFTAFSDMVVWAIHYRGVRQLLHYLDDFLLFGQPCTLEPGRWWPLHGRSLQRLVSLLLSIRLKVLQHQLPSWASL